MDFDDILKQQELETLRGALSDYLQKVCSPAFGALPKSEMQLLLLSLLERLNAVSPAAGEYELVSKLRVTRSKARKLIYERELRRLTQAELDQQVRELLKRPIIQKAGEVFALDVDSPLVSDHLRARVREMGYISDGSFSPSVVKLPLDAVVALMDYYIPQGEQERVRQALVAAGAPDTSLKGILRAALGKVAHRVAAETGDALMQEASEFLEPVLDAAVERIKDKFTGVFSE